MCKFEDNVSAAVLATQLRRNEKVADLNAVRWVVSLRPTYRAHRDRTALGTKNDSALGFCYPVLNDTLVEEGAWFTRNEAQLAARRYQRRQLPRITGSRRVKRTCGRVDDAGGGGRMRGTHAAVAFERWTARRGGSYYWKRAVCSSSLRGIPLHSKPSICGHTVNVGGPAWL